MRKRIGERLRLPLGNDHFAYSVAYHIGDIIDDMTPFLHLLETRRLTKEEVMEFVDCILIHWPFHQEGLRYELRKAGLGTPRALRFTPDVGATKPPAKRRRPTTRPRRHK